MSVNARDRAAPVVLGRLLLSAVAAFSLHCGFAPVPAAAGSTALAGLFGRISATFANFGLVDLIAVAAVYAALSYLGRRAPGFGGWAFALAAVMALSYTVSRSFFETDSLGFFTAGVYQRCLSAFCVAGYTVLFYAALRLCFLYAEGDMPRRPGVRAENIGRLGFALILLCWLPHIIVNYPGNIGYDPVTQLRQYFGVTGWSSTSPPLNTLLIGSLLSLGGKLVDNNFGIFLYILLQTLVGALCFSLAMEKLYKLGASLRLCAAGLLFYALLPLWGVSAAWYQKDLMYTELAVLILAELAELISRRELSARRAAGLAALVLLATQLRHNGIYEFLPVLLALTLYLKGGDRRRMAAASASVLALYLGVTRLLLPALGVGESSAGELYGIPFQQTARYVQCFPEDVTEYEREVIDSVLDYDKLDQYRPRIVDDVKNTYRGDADKLGEYMRVWFAMGKRHPAVYAEALLNKCFGYLAPVEENLEALLKREEQGFLTQRGISQVFAGPALDTYDELVVAGVYLPLLRYLYMPGFYTWLALACAALLLKDRKRAALLLFIPGLVTLIICIGSPLHNAIRYELPLVGSAPLLIGWTRIHVSGRSGAPGPGK